MKQVLKDFSADNKGNSEIAAINQAVFKKLSTDHFVDVNKKG